MQRFGHSWQLEQGKVSAHFVNDLGTFQGSQNVPDVSSGLVKFLQIVTVNLKQDKSPA